MLSFSQITSLKKDTEEKKQMLGKRPASIIQDDLLSTKAETVY
jgi:hypothetical protein